MIIRFHYLSKGKIMTGKTHKFIGLVAGGAVAYYGIAVLNEPLYIVAAFSSAIGAMIPDIDHNNSSIGSKRKKIFNFLSVIIGLVILCTAMLFLIFASLNDTLWSSVVTLALILLPFGVLTALTKIEFVQRNIKFIVKHRGFMHTLILPACMVAALFVIKEPVFAILLQGLLIGFVSHLFMDILNPKGCPILYPISKSNIKIMNIKTGGKGENVAGAVVAACIIVGILIYSGTVKVNLPF